MAKEIDLIRDIMLKDFLNKYSKDSGVNLLSIRTKVDNFVKFDGDYGQILMALSASDDRLIEYIKVYETPYVKFNNKILKNIRTVLIEFDHTDTVDMIYS